VVSLADIPEPRQAAQEERGYISLATILHTGQWPMGKLHLEMQPHAVHELLKLSYGTGCSFRSALWQRGDQSPFEFAKKHERDPLPGFLAKFIASKIWGVSLVPDYWYE
jgi:hypothetical protein